MTIFARIMRRFIFLGEIKSKVLRVLGFGCIFYKKRKTPLLRCPLAGGAEGLEPLRGPLAVPKICCSLSASPNFDRYAILTSLLLAPRALR